MIQITNEKIDEAALLEFVRSKKAGAISMFLGTTREITGDQVTELLEYTAYEEMAQKELEKLESKARQRWPVLECAIVHRLGRVDPAETSVAIVVSTPHRKDSFEASRWLIDQIKESVPIWKKENFKSGEKVWVHPNVEEEGQGR